MKTILTVAVLFVVAAANLAAQEPAKTKVAIVRLDRIVNSGVNFEKLRLLQTDKEAVEAMQKINGEIQSLQKEIINAENEATLSQVGRKVQFLNQKMNLLRQRFMNNQMDMHAAVRDFVVENYKGQYSLILQLDQNYSNQVVWIGNAEVVDITDEAADKLKNRMKQVFGQQNFGWGGNYFPVPATFATPVLAPVPPATPDMISMPRPDGPVVRTVPPASSSTTPPAKPVATTPLN